MDAHSALILSAVALSFGPLIAGVLQRRSQLHALLDGFILVMVGGLALLHLLPYARDNIGAWCILFAAIGAFLPLYAERKLHRHESDESSSILWLAVIGLVLHASLDGAALAANQQGMHEHLTEGWSLPLAILLHRVPVGLLIWWSVRPQLGSKIALAILAAIAGATFVGHALSSFLLPLSVGPVSGIIFSLLAGGLLHVVMDHRHQSEHGEARVSPAWAASGTVLALLIFFLLPDTVPPVLQRGFSNMGYLFMESSYAVVLGFVGAGFMTMVPARSLKQLLKGSTEASSALKGILFGIPLPICSCGVVPLYRSLHARGVPAAAATAFLVATPELGFDSILISIPLLGTPVTIVRLIAAFLVALVAGLVAGRLMPSSEAAEFDDPATLPPRNDLKGALDFGARELFDDLGPWVLVGILVAGLIEPILRNGLIALIPDLIQVPIFGLIATPFYVCASGATPIATIFLAKGASVGAVLAFLLTGPATNVTTYGAIKGVHRRQAVWILMLTVPVSSILLGWLANLVPGLAASVPELGSQAYSYHWWQKAGVVLFVALLLGSLFRQGPRGLLHQVGIGRGA
jgi:hypothetical protein